MTKTVLLTSLVFFLLCGGFGCFTALPTLIGFIHSVGAGHFGAMSSFEQGNLVGRLIGGPLCGGTLGLLFGALVGFLIAKAKPKPE